MKTSAKTSRKTRGAPQIARDENSKDFVPSAFTHNDRVSEDCRLCAYYDSAFQKMSEAIWDVIVVIITLITQRSVVDFAIDLIGKRKVDQQVVDAAKALKTMVTTLSVMRSDYQKWVLNSLAIGCAADQSGRVVGVLLKAGDEYKGRYYQSEEIFCAEFAKGAALIKDLPLVADSDELAVLNEVFVTFLAVTSNVREFIDGWTKARRAGVEQ
jgi:hypothetical protein